MKQKIVTIYFTEEEVEFEFGAEFEKHNALTKNDTINEVIALLRDWKAINLRRN